MKNICVALCLSLFASLIHAAVMPMDVAGHVLHSSIDFQHVNLEQDRHCHDMSSDHHQMHTQERKQVQSTQLCHGDNYQCCLGLVISPLPNLDLSTALSDHLASVNSLWVINPIAYFIYKPPKYVLTI